MIFHNFSRNVTQKSSVLLENVSTFFFTYIQIVFSCLLLYLICYQKIFSFSNFPNIINFVMHKLAANIQNLQNIFHVPFQLYSIVFVCLSQYLWFFLNKSSILSVILCNPPFYHTYVRGKSSVLSECLHFLFQLCVIVFVCLSLYLRCFKENLKFFQLSYVILNFIIHMLDENLQFIQKCLHILFQLYSN